MAVPGLEQLPGTELAAGSFTISAEEDAKLAQVVGDGAPAGAAQPLWAYVATQRGIGVSVEELCALADFDVNDGPLLGSTAMTWSQPIERGVEYAVAGEIVDIARKSGRSGTFDILTYRERLLAPNGDEVASSTSAWILPRKEA
ncbi:MAG TPA: hypothetical protein VGM91_15405 [Conexibacter sp.]|jgi:hypothetical protein